MSGEDDRRPDQGTLTATEAIGAVAPAPLPPTLPRGAALGRYIVIDRLGGGGMGVVYSAYDPELDRKLAVKLLKPEAAADQTRLLREARAMARLSHPNVIAVHDVGALDGRVFVAMELVDGVTLSDWLTETTRDWRDVVSLFVQAGRGLAAAHAVGLVHRDFKPANVLVGRDGRVRVVDFGLARAVGSADAASAEPLAAGQSAEASPSLSRSPSLHETLTRTGALLGTPTYMAPEMWQGRAADARTDQFSFAVALYRALWNTRPFGEGDDAGAIGREVVAGRLRPPPKDSRVPAWLRDVVLRGLASAPEARWPSMDAMLAGLEHDPARRRRLVLAGAGALAAAAAVAVGARAMVMREARACRAGGDRVAQFWDDTRRDAMHRAFIATGLPRAENAFATASRALDSFAATWTAAYRDACEATVVRHEQSNELYDLRMDCLSQRLQDARAGVELLTRADANVVDNAPRLTSSLTTRPCGDVATLREPVPPPTDASSKERLDALHARLSKMRALDLAGKHREAATLAGPLAADAHAFGYKPFEAQVLYWKGWIHSGAGDYKAADEMLEEAVLVARASRETRMEVNAYTSLTWNADRLGQYDRARSMARHALAAYDAGGAEERNLAWALTALSSTEADAGNTREALKLSERALTIREKYMAEAPNDVAASHEAVGRTLGDLGDYRGEEQHLRRALAIYDTTFGREHPDYASVLFNLGLAQVGQGHLEEGLRSYREAIAIAERTRGPEHPGNVIYMANLGDVLVRLGKLDEAIAFNRRALALCAKVRPEQHPDTVVMATNLGEVLLRAGKTDEAIALFRRAIAIGEKILPPSHPLLLNPVIDLGLAEVTRHQPARAVEPVERALQLLDKQGTNTLLRAEARFVLARALWDADGDRARARTLATEARPLYQKEMREDRLAMLDAWLAAHR
jgi:eukaryotic-like serine/threonine-protein kinase